MSRSGEHSTPGSVVISKATILQILEEMRALREDVARLEKAVRRPGRVRYRPEELAQRLQISISSVYRLWKSGLLPYSQDSKGRYSTEAQVERYELSLGKEP